MKFTVNDKTYFVKWQYIENYVTLCIVYDNQTSFQEPLVIEAAYLSKEDRFCKNTGRKVSLERALSKLFPSIPSYVNTPESRKTFKYSDRWKTYAKARTIAWAEYFKESPKRLK